ncbi:transcription factor HES-5-like [Pelmatolapia mariae]|uniref:transcription factor HES-5-like n=1 Tax=Pelmatolapia mariae TaxID=158779 RepID=UPI002FE6B924
MKAEEIRVSLQRPLQHRDPAMAPTVSPVMTNSQDHVTLNHKLRKPLVEKIRREGINSSTEQLKSLLGPELLNQQPDSKLEKADILEMTVCFLRRLQQQRQTAESGVLEQGYSRCAQEMVNFLSKVEVKTQSQRNLLNHINQLHTSSDKTLSEADFSPLSYTVQTSITKDKTVTSSLWRPW